MKYGCIDVLLRHGVQRGDIVELEVPGAFELPFAAKSTIMKASPSTGNIDAVVALGCLIKGETMHLSHNNTTAAATSQQQPQPNCSLPPLATNSTCVLSAVSTSARPYQPG